MKTIIIALILSLSILNLVHADVCTDNYVFDSDGTTTGSDYHYLSSLSDLSSCTKIDGSLTISNCKSLSSLPLTSLVEITEDLTITDNTKLTKLTGLASLTKVSGTVTIGSNAILTDLTLTGLTYAGALNVHDNYKLLNVASLSKLASVGGPSGTGDLSLKTNDRMTDLSFSALTNIAGSLSIESNDGLEQISGFNALTNVGGNLIIRDNGALMTTITGFSKLKTIATALDIYGNTALTSITGLVSLTSADSLNIESNPVLTTLTLSKVTSLPSGITLSGSPALTNFSIDVTGSLVNLNIINTGLSNVNVFCKVTSVSNLFIQSNANLQNLHGLSNIVTTDSISVYSNPSLTSLEGLSSIQTVNDDINIYDNAATCGTFYSNAQDMFPGYSRFECCGDGVVQSGNHEECEGNSSCSAVCKVCNASSSATNCNCNTNLCLTKPYGLCLNNGSCLFSETYINTALCGKKLTGVTYATGGSTSASPSKTTSNVVPTTVDSGSCFINDTKLYCSTIFASKFSLLQYLEASNSLSIVGSTVVVNLNTHVVLDGSLVIRNGSKLVIGTNPWKSHVTVTIFEYTNIDGDFASVSFNNTVNPCLKYTLTKESKAMKLKVWNQCVDDENVNSSVTSLFVLIIILAVGGGGLWWFVKNRKKQERKAGGLGN